MLLVVLLFGATVVSCSEDAEEPEPASEQTSEQTSEPLPEESSFLDEVGSGEYEAVEPRQESYRIRWDLQTEADYKYDYTQQVRNRHHTGTGPSDAGGMEQTMRGNGVLTVRSKGDGTADLILDDLTMEMNMDDTSESMKQTTPPVVVKGMNEAGNASEPDTRNTQREEFLKMLFPVPPDPIQQGETVRVDRKMPFNAMGSPLYVRGYSEITFTRMVNIDGNRCIQLDVKTDVTRLKVPEEMEGEYEATMTGQSRYFFNVERRVFQKGKQALLMTMHIDAPTPDINKKNIPDHQSADIPSRMQMKMSNDNLFELNLRK